MIRYEIKGVVIFAKNETEANKIFVMQALESHTAPVTKMVVSDFDFEGAILARNEKIMMDY